MPIIIDYYSLFRLLRRSLASPSESEQFHFQGAHFVRKTVCGSVFCFLSKLLSLSLSIWFWPGRLSQTNSAQKHKQHEANGKARLFTLRYLPPRKASTRATITQASWHFGRENPNPSYKIINRNKKFENKLQRPDGGQNVGEASAISRDRNKKVINRIVRLRVCW